MKELVYWRSAKIPTVQYGARDICLTIKQSVEDDKAESAYEEIKSFVDERVEAQANAITNQLTDNDYRIKNGVKYPRVSKILDPDSDENKMIQSKEFGSVPLKKYGLKGTYYHELANRTLIGVQHPDNIKQPDISPLKYDLDIKGFFDKYGDKFAKEKRDFELNREVFNEHHLYSGEIDYLGVYDGKYTLGDFKTGQWKLEQLVAYYKCNTDQVERLAIFDLKNTKVITWDVNSPEVQEAWERFLILRGQFKERFKI